MKTNIISLLILAGLMGVCIAQTVSSAGRFSPSGKGSLSMGTNQNNGDENDEENTEDNNEDNDT